MPRIAAKMAQLSVPQRVELRQKLLDTPLGSVVTFSAPQIAAIARLLMIVAYRDTGDIANGQGKSLARGERD